MATSRAGGARAQPPTHAVLDLRLLEGESGLDLIELAEDNLSRAVRERCEPFYQA